MANITNDHMSSHRVGGSSAPQESSGFLKFILFALICAIGYFAAQIYIAKFPREYLKVEQLSSMKDDEGVLSAHERGKLLAYMGKIRENTGLTLSFHIAETDPVPRRSGPNSLTIAISTKKQSVKYRIPYAFREMLGADESEAFVKNLETRYGLCLQLPIPRKVPHCLEDTMIAIEEKTINHERASLLFASDQEDRIHVQPIL